jgi:molecular chaperone DnaK
MAERAFGIDFGTTNSMVATVAGEGRVTCFTDPDDLPHPSVVWYAPTGTVVGRKARDQLAKTDQLVVGDFVVSPKRLLGQSSVQHVGGRKLRPADIAAEVLRYLKRDADDIHLRGDSALSRAVMTIPVKLDGRGRRTLREAAGAAGVEVVQFVHEPLAALYAWMRMQPDPETWAARMQSRPMLVFDWGGGTLDLTLCVIEDGRLLQIENDFDHTVGGDEFDSRLRALVREKHARQHGLRAADMAEPPNSASRLRVRCEQAKISLSTSQQAPVVVPQYLPGSVGQDLAVIITRDELLETTRDLIEQGLAAIDRLLTSAACNARAVEMVLPTGGMVGMPAIRDALVARFESRVMDVGTVSRGDRIIAEGAAFIAADGPRLELSKPLEVEEADREYAELLAAGTTVPIIDAATPTIKRLYCVDPAKGEATIRFVKPAGLGSYGRSDIRQPLQVSTLPVAQDCRPFTEELELRLRLDRNCVADVELFATVKKGQPVRAEIVDLEFGIALPWAVAAERPHSEWEAYRAWKDRGKRLSTAEAGAVRLISNVASAKDWRRVPGNIVKHYDQAYFNDGANLYSMRQKDQFLAYARCCRCHRRDEVIWRDGCVYCAVASGGQPAPDGHFTTPTTE